MLIASAAPVEAGVASPGDAGRTLAAALMGVPPQLVNAEEDWKNFLADAEGLIQRKLWDEAIEILQKLIELTDSGFVAGPEGRLYSSLWSKTNEVLGKMGAEGLKRYRRRFSLPARRMYEKAVADGDESGLRRVAYQFRWTEYGTKAVEALGTMAFDRGRFTQAARFWRQAMALRGPHDSDPLLLTKVAAASHLAGEKTVAQTVAQRLKKHHPDAVAKIGGRKQNLVAFVERVFAMKPAAEPVAARQVKGWPGLGGIPDGMGVMAESDVVLVPWWRRPEPKPTETTTGATVAPTVELIAGKGILSGLSPSYQVLTRLQDGHVQLSIKRRTGSSSRYQNQGGALPPLVHPVVVGNMVICRQENHVVAYDLLTGEIDGGGWRSLPMAMYGKPGASGTSGMVFSGYNPYGPSIGDFGQYMLTVGGDMVFAVYHYTPPQYNVRHVMIGIRGGTKPTDTSNTSSIGAIKLDGGKLIWKVGAGEGTHDVVRNGKFLTAPTYHAGRLYAVVLHQQSHHLVCMDATKKGAYIWSSMIAQTPAVQRRYGRHMDYLFWRGSPPAVADGTVYATTNSGAVAAFEADTGRPIWAYQYDSQVNNAHASRYGTPTSTTQLNPPNPMIVTNSQVICLPADSTEVLALSAEDGRKLWGRPRGKQQMLSAIGADRVLLSGPGLVVLATKDGRELYGQMDKGVVGRPAVTPSAVLASGKGTVIRMALKGYYIKVMNRAAGMGSTGLLGNLISTHGMLIAANAAGICAYSDYTHAHSAMSKRIESANPEQRLRMLFLRSQVAFRAKRFDEALADLRKCEKASPTGANDFQQRLASLYRQIYIALGNQADKPEKMLEWFRKADAKTVSKRDKAHMRVRLIKCHERMGEYAQAVETAQAFSEELGELTIADIPIGPKANDVAPLGPHSENLTAAEWARGKNGFIQQLIKKRGQKVYATLDAKAEAALSDAKTRSDTTALWTLSRRWPNSIWADDAQFAAAELYYTEACGKKDEAADELLAKAVRCLSAVAGLAKSPLRVSATVGLAIIYARGGWEVVVGQTLNDVRDLPDHTPVAFADIRGRLGSLIREIDGGKLPAFVSPISVPASVEMPLAKIFSIAGATTFIARDQEYRPVRIGERVLIIKGNRAVLINTAAGEYDKDWPEMITGAAATPSPSAIYPGYGTVAGLSGDGKVVGIADSTRLRGYNLATGKLVWDKSGTALGLQTSRFRAVGDGAAVTVDSRGEVGCVELATGELKWKSPGHSSPFCAPRIAAGCVFVRHNSGRTLTCINVTTGKVIWKHAAKSYLEIHPTAEGLVAVMADEELTVREIGKMDKPLWSLRFAKNSRAAILGASNHRIVVLPNQTSNEVKVYSMVAGRPVASFTAPDFGGTRSAPVDAIIDGDQLLVICSAGQRGRPKSVMGRLSYTNGLNVQSYDLDKQRWRWSSDVQLPHQYPMYVLPMVLGRKHLVVSARSSSIAGLTFVAVVDRATGKTVKRIDLGGMAAAAAAQRLRVIGPPVMTNGRLVLEDKQGVTIHGSK